MYQNVVNKLKNNTNNCNNRNNAQMKKKLKTTTSTPIEIRKKKKHEDSNVVQHCLNRTSVMTFVLFHFYQMVGQNERIEEKRFTSFSLIFLSK